MFIRCRGGHDTVLSKILYGRHPLGPVVSMWPPTGAEKARQEIKEARGFVCAPLPASNTTTSPHNLPSLPPSPPCDTHMDSAPIFSYYRKRGGKRGQNTTY